MKDCIGVFQRQSCSVQQWYAVRYQKQSRDPHISVSPGKKVGRAINEELRRNANVA
jgi:hypothetical protein